MEGLTGCRSLLIVWANWIELKAVSGLGVTSESKSARIFSGRAGVLVIEGVLVMVGVSVIVGVRVMVGVSVMVGVLEGVNVGGKY